MIEIAELDAFTHFKKLCQGVVSSAIDENVSFIALGLTVIVDSAPG
jgi:hypothetical protein